MFGDTIDFEKYLSYNDSSFENQIDDNANFNDLSFTHGKHPFDEKQDNIEISTNIKSNLNENHSEKKDNFSNKESSNHDNSSNDYPFKKIKDKNPKYKYNLIEDKNVKQAEKKLLNKKRKNEKEQQETKSIEQTENEDEIEQEDEIVNENKIKRGRKTNNSEENKGNVHNKMSSDNIFRKIKSKIFNEYLLAFGNKMINKNENDKERLYKLDYKYINKIKKKEDLEFLNMQLQKILSLDVTPKQRNKTTNNKNLIEKNIKDIKEQVVKDGDTILFALNMKLKDWLDLFLLKKNIDEDLKKKYNNVDFKKIVECIGDVKVLLDEILQENDERYFSLFILYLYNYEKYFDIKRNRNNKDSEKKK